MGETHWDGGNLLPLQRAARDAEARSTETKENDPVQAIASTPPMPPNPPIVPLLLTMHRGGELRAALQEMKTFRNRYGSIDELKEVFEAMEKVARRNSI